MSVVLRRASERDAEVIWRMQKEAFAELLERYRDYDTSPGCEPLEKVLMRLRQSFTYFYFIEVEGAAVGVIRIVDMKDDSRKRVSPLFIMPEYRGKGYAQAAMLAAEQIHGQDSWQLGTILQEAGNCYLYEKLGYHKTGETKVINERMTLVFYEKN